MLRPCALLLFLFGCDGGGRNSALFGTWSKGTSDNSLVIVFQSDGHTTNTDHDVDSTTHCIDDASYNGTWTSTDTTLTITYSDGTIETTGCTDPTMNLEKSAVGAQQAGINNLTDAPWAISGNTLTITVSHSLVSFTKQ